MSTKTLNVKYVTVAEIEKNWHIPFPKRHNENYASCNAKGEINWTKTTIYTKSELAVKKKVNIVVNGMDDLDLDGQMDHAEWMVESAIGSLNRLRAENNLPEISCSLKLIKAAKEMRALLCDCKYALNFASGNVITDTSNTNLIKKIEFLIETTRK